MRGAFDDMLAAIPLNGGGAQTATSACSSQAPPSGTRQAQAEALRRVGGLAAPRHGAAAGPIALAGDHGSGRGGAGRSAYAHDRHGDLVTIVEPGGARTSYAYDQRRRLTRVDRPGGTTRYTYGENDRLTGVDDDGVLRRFSHDPAGRVTTIRHGDAGASVFRYDAEGRVVEARTGSVSTRHDYDTAGRLVGVRQTIDGVLIELRLEFDQAGLFARMSLPGRRGPIRYRWDARGRPAAVALGDEVIARYEYDDTRRTQSVRFLNGVLERTCADPLDACPLCAPGAARRADPVRAGHTATGRLASSPPTGRGATLMTRSAA